MRNLSDLAPSGRLRAAVVTAPAASAFFAIEREGKLQGVTVDLFQALAENVKLPLTLRAFPNSGEATEAIAAGECDVAFMPRDADREKKVAFGPAYIVIESTFLVPARSKLKTLDEANFAGARAIAIAGTTTGRSARRFLTQGIVEDVRSVEEMVDLAKRGEADLFALSRDAFATLLPQVPGARVLPGGFQQVGVAIAVPKGRPEAEQIVRNFLDSAKRSGIVRRALDRGGYRDLPVASF
ncbi:MAG: transporter substrate-binding domain-containing protein [Pseudolabrys sp.]|nr:transporter substrate-binding domain-containing protein [Pseudolabrys sp.]